MLIKYRVDYDEKYIFKSPEQIGRAYGTLSHLTYHNPWLKSHGYYIGRSYGAYYNSRTAKATCGITRLKLDKSP